jgi:hypothetical protein
MHYKVPGLASTLEGPTRFLKEMAVEAPEKLESLTITAAQVPEQTRIVLLEPKQ